MRNKNKIPSMELSGLETNYSRITKIFGRDFLDRSYRDILTPKDVEEANEVLANEVYGKNLATAIREKKTDKIDSAYHLLEEEYKKDISSSVDMRQIGLVLVRPEQFDNRNQYIQFLKDLKLNILYSGEKKIDMKQYFLLYKDALTSPYTKNDYPTRTFNYIDKKSFLIVAFGNPKEYHCDSIGDYLSSLQGTAGKFSKNTFRGDIAINSMLKYIDKNNNLKQEANILLDPIGSYRMLVKGKVAPYTTDYSHEEADIPILFYSGQSIHIPNQSELERDFSIICTNDEINKAFTTKTLTKKLEDIER